MKRVDARLRLTQGQRNQWDAIRPILASHLAELWPIYRQATPEQQALLREHNPVLAEVVAMLGGD